MGEIRDFRQLRVYQTAFEAAMTLFEASASWPKVERYAITDQIRRSSRAVCANIAEAWFKRRYPKHFVSKLSDAGSEASETLVWLDFAERCGYLDASVADFRDRYEFVIGGLVRMMARPEQWCASTVREPEAPYVLDLDTDS